MSNNLTICGIDIGLSGGICIYKNPDDFELINMPLSVIRNKRFVNLEEYKSILDSYNIDIIIYEDIKSIFGIRKSTMLSLGEQIGYIKMYSAINNITTYKVAPKIWQSKLHKDIPLIQIEGNYKESIYKSISFIVSLIGMEKFKEKFSINKKFTNKEKYHEGWIDAFMIAHYYNQYVKRNNQKKEGE